VLQHIDLVFDCDETAMHVRTAGWQLLVLVLSGVSAVCAGQTLVDGVAAAVYNVIFT
jgi:hypothetical protein